MPTPYESAQLLLKLYDLRREDLMRKARDFFFTFDPKSFDEFKAGFFGPQSASIRMVISYWDMATSLVNNGAIDGKMFLEASGEFVLVFARVEPYLPQFREIFGPGFMANLETYALSIPNARQRIDTNLLRVREMLQSQGR